jgi:hypothetical protein
VSGTKMRYVEEESQGEVFAIATMAEMVEET